jgi:CcmD family protein
MGAFVTAYVVVWLGIVLYIVRMGAEQRRLSRAVEGLRSHLEDSRAASPSPRKAA